jgi:hypothetical protein
VGAASFVKSEALIKNKTTTLVVLILTKELVAGAGFEPTTFGL